MRIGVSIGRGRARVSAAVLDPDTNDVRAAAANTLAPADSDTEALRRSTTALPGTRTEASSVTIAGDWVTRSLATGVDLAPAAALRLAQPGGTALPPLLGWPEHLRTTARERWAVVSGGHDPLGRPLAELDTRAVAEFARRVRDDGAQGIAVTAAGSPAVPGHEIAAAEIIEQVAPDLRVVLAHELGALGLRARENTAVLNAALCPLAATVLHTCQSHLTHHHPGAAPFFVRYDGSVVNGESFRRLPVTTADAHLAAELCGASALAGQQNALVVAFGAETTDIGLVDRGRPHHAPQGTATIAPGMPVSLPLPIHETVSGGTRAFTGDGAAQAATDLVRVVTRLQESAVPRPVLVVGDPGAAAHLPQALAAHAPPNGTAAAAVGAALAQPAAEISRVVLAERSDLSLIQEEARAEALAAVARAGADPASAHIVAERVGPVGYLPSNVHRLWVRAAGHVGGHP
ncbi:hydantoinase/oxoprolinase family protein [Lipingzhangella sp. LS1_29]|uniref:Hydantoinase/oxoprolinase family protein n=2 Tax=Lipingzhangella rawalii TaxID=2055835 RepID=A0ABU2H610_9ACTN|nr:hydantoinase/oxoprolinase family protein [Lipingzhangella rawalii]